MIEDPQRLMRGRHDTTQELSRQIGARVHRNRVLRLDAQRRLHLHRLEQRQCLSFVEREPRDPVQVLREPEPAVVDAERVAAAREEVGTFVDGENALVLGELRVQLVQLGELRGRVQGLVVDDGLRLRAELAHPGAGFDQSNGHDFSLKESCAPRHQTRE
ncbi:MAG TPA: hypothetical protein VJR25_05025 [Microbacterium sp.]|uniref:hypothetical protein n=1 Tax=Microbacterium sp. TaxID=51671 RepID=UPI002B493406|nr:hypothetical protein [Microbacterium sp.]HKT56114.1 hypothetical protein [Microbacterium sp.]